MDSIRHALNPARHSRRPARETPPAVPAAIAALAGEPDYADRPLGGYGGELLPSPPPAPAPPAPFVIPPPDWENETGAALPAAAAAPATRLDALAEMKLASGEEFPELDLGAPLKLEPLRRPQLPPPNWREEEAARAARDRGPTVVKLEPAKSLEPRPAPGRGKP